MKNRLKIIVTGLIGQHYTMGGVTWDYIQYLIGLNRLGHDVYYFEDSGEWPYNLDGGSTGDNWVADNCNENVNYINKVLKRFNLEKFWAYKCPLSEKWFGLSDQERKEIINSADLLINVSGSLVNPSEYRAIKKMVYIDSDPGFTEVKLNSQEFAERVMVHDLHFSFGELLHKKEMNSGIRWLPTRSPIVISEWDFTDSVRNVYTTVMNWTSYKPLTWLGKVYSQKDAEFIKFIQLPHEFRSKSFEVAMSNVQHTNWKTNINGNRIADQFDSPADLLISNGWHVVDSQKTCQNMDNYRSYILTSRGEWSVAKGGYVVDKTGWFSCRSACYLAAGKPVVVQSTGFEDVIPTGDGLFAFYDLEQAVGFLEDIESNYDHHCKAAKEIAKEFLDSGKVLNHLINQF